MKEINYNVIQGDSFLLSLTYTDSSGSAINLTGASALLEVKDQPGGRILCAKASGADVPSLDGSANDLFNNAIDLSKLPVPFTFYNAMASESLQTNEPWSEPNYDDRFSYSVWFKYTPSTSGPLYLELRTIKESGHYIGMGVYTGNIDNGLDTVEAGNGGGPVNYTVQLDAGTTYYIQALSLSPSNSVHLPVQSFTLYGDWESINDGISFTASAGKIDINLTPEKTKLFNYPRSAYQLQLTTSGGIKTTLLNGWFLVNAGVID